MLTISGTKAILVVIGLVVHYPSVQRAIVSLLQFDRVCAAFFRRAEEFLGRPQVALVIVADLGDDVAIGVVADACCCYGQFSCHKCTSKILIVLSAGYASLAEGYSEPGNRVSDDS